MGAPCTRKIWNGKPRRKGPRGRSDDLMGLIHPTYFRSVNWVEGVWKSSIRKTEALTVKGQMWKESDVVRGMVTLNKPIL